MHQGGEDWDRAGAPPDHWSVTNAAPDGRTGVPYWQSPGTYSTDQYSPGYQSPLAAFDGHGPRPLPSSRPPSRASWVPLAWIGAGIGALVLLGFAGALLIGQLNESPINAPAAAIETTERPRRDVPTPPRAPLPSRAIQPVAVRASCEAPPGQDANGNRVDYWAEQTVDGFFDTAWRCPGSATREQLIYDFGHTVTLTAVGLVPGYAKVDPFDGTNRFLQNRTVTGVSWIFDDGSALDQVIARPQPMLTGVELVTPVTTRMVVLHIATTGNDFAERDYTAISEVSFEGRPRS